MKETIQESPYGDKTGEHMLTTFEGAGELAHYIATTKPNKNASQDSRRKSDSWHGGVNYEQASDLAETGWSDAPKLTGSDIANNLRDYAEGQREGTIASVSGAFLDMGAYCSGQPECFQEFTEVETPRGVVLGVNIGALSDISPTEMTNRGVVLMAIVDELERNGFSVSLEAFWHSRLHKGGGEHWSTLRFPLKRMGERVDENLLAFWACHPAALRQMGFAWQECHDDVWVKRMDVNEGRGQSRDPESLEGIDYLFGSTRLPRDEEKTLEYYKTAMAGIEKVLAT